MTDEFRVPKREVSVMVVLPGRPPTRMNIYLAECAQSHAGFERPSDLLNGSEHFLPAADPSGKVVFLHRNAVTVVSVDADQEFGEDIPRAEQLAPEKATTLKVEVVLEDGTSIRGNITYLMPEGQKRLQDVLNLEDLFLILREGDKARLINKRRIVRVSQQ